ncbi:UNVERIFIED_CONTAM: putative transmembrane ascorbate ferrireductase 2 [Sesamum radiatum]|uniref:Transmembrane ascorbate ferrireductase 2 n=1 Tax=Sesamum radiatum TaxID=300843 RepID=A0AAW2VA74_SESRA
MAVPVVRFPIFLVVRIIGVAVAALVLIWNVHYRGGLALVSENKSLIFNVHPVLMVIGLVLLNGEGMSSIGIDNFYSLHSWLGLLCLFLFGIQWAFGFATFWYPGGSRNSRASLLPWHVFFGLYIYALSIATCATGFLEKATFLQTHQIISRYSKEAVLVNSLGMLVVVLAGFVILGVVSPVYGKGHVEEQQNRYSKDNLEI